MIQFGGLIQQTKQLIKKLSALPLFAKTPPATLGSWLEGLQSEIIEKRSGESIGNGERRLGLLLSGRAKIHSADNGRNVILREMRAPTVFGAASLFCEGELPMSRIEAVTACTALLIGADDVRTLMSADESFRDAYLAFLADRVRFLNLCAQVRISQQQNLFPADFRGDGRFQPCRPCSDNCYIIPFHL